MIIVFDVHRILVFKMIPILWRLGLCHNEANLHSFVCYLWHSEMMASKLQLILFLFSSFVLLSPKTRKQPLFLSFLQRPWTQRKVGIADVNDYKTGTKALCDCFDFTLFRSVIGVDNLCPTLDQSKELKLKPTATWSPAFSRAWGSLPVLTLSFHWPMI